jgi:hypothetical protein
MKFKKLISIVSICNFSWHCSYFRVCLRIEILKSVIAGYATMKFNTAFSYNNRVLYLLNNENSRVITTSFLLFLFY